ncbi:hypothetical protein H8F23_23525 [Pseudomonas sp. P155]|uniref:Uncharacterized protein n=1 Tax=Pseudomonas neuropathica TaxID=2730425 RepID=A0ABS0BP52_9PSED|nr:hypothetical protein [Pseudomonas neuropathica]MBF6036229.1 hypothetical protein [Pseudomonas neuropathica]
MSSDYKKLVKTKSTATGKFEVEVEGYGKIEQLDIYLSEQGDGFEVGVRDDPPGNMPPTRFLFIEFPNKTAIAKYDVKELKRFAYHDYSEWHSYEFVPESGSVKVKYQDSPRQASGEIDVKGRLVGSPPPQGPVNVRIFGTFDLKEL